VIPGRPDSAGLDELPDPEPAEDELLVAGLLVGVCGTDLDVLHHPGAGEPPAGRERMVLFHESFGRVVSAPPDSGFTAGDLVTGVVRRPDPVPCPSCARGRWDLCRNGRYTERGIRGLDGFGAQLWTVEPRFALKLDPALGELGVLTEPCSVIAKAWEQAEQLGRVIGNEPRVALVTGAGPIGLLATLLGVQRGLDVHVLERATDGPKPDLVRQLGATHHDSFDSVDSAHLDPDVVIECTGAGEVLFGALRRTARNAVMVLTGISGEAAHVTVPGGAVNDELVLENDLLVGSVNAAFHHYRQAAEALAAADHEWLRQLITRRVPLGRWTEALERRPDDVKVVVDLQG